MRPSTDAEAECNGEFVERLDDDGAHTGLIAIAPHGGDIEAYTDQQAERVTSQLAGKGVSSWRCKGWHPKGAFDHWHITSTDIHEASFPLLNSVISRGFSNAVAFHGFDDANIPFDILVGGLACEALKEKVKGAIEGVVGSDFTVHITKPDERFGGDDQRNIVNRLTAGGRHGIQIEQKKGPREKYCVAHRRCSRQRLRLRARATHPTKTELVKPTDPASKQRLALAISPRGM